MSLSSEQIEELQENFPSVNTSYLFIIYKYLNLILQLIQNGRNGDIQASDIQAALKLLGIDLPGYQVSHHL
jgi:hypothetical protein